MHGTTHVLESEIADDVCHLHQPHSKDLGLGRLHLHRSGLGLGVVNEPPEFGAICEGGHLRQQQGQKVGQLINQSINSNAKVMYLHQATAHLVQDHGAVK